MDWMNGTKGLDGILDQNGPAARHQVVYRKKTLLWTYVRLRGQPCRPIAISAISPKQYAYGAILFWSQYIGSAGAGLTRGSSARWGSTTETHKSQPLPGPPLCSFDDNLPKKLP